MRLPRPAGFLAPVGVEAERRRPPRAAHSHTGSNRQAAIYGHYWGTLTDEERNDPSGIPTTGTRGRHSSHGSARTASRRTMARACRRRISTARAGGDGGVLQGAPSPES
jgi:hypothetical protein